jgi:hypothetical protein
LIAWTITSPPADSIHLDLNYSRSWFQTPNSYDNLNVQNVVSGGTSASPVFGNVGNADQRSKIGTINISPTYTRIIGNNAVFNLGAFVRRDDYNYYPSGNPLADLGPANLQTSSIAQNRTLTNAAVHSDLSYAKGIHNIKAARNTGRPSCARTTAWAWSIQCYNAPCVGADGNPYRRVTPTSHHAPRREPAYLPVLAPYDLTRGGGSTATRPHRREGTWPTFEDQIKAGNWLFNLGCAATYTTA